MTWFSNSKTISVVEQVVGRVNCVENPILCQSSGIVDDTSSSQGGGGGCSLPQLVRIFPWDNAGPEEEGPAPDLVVAPTTTNLTDDDSFTQRMKEYGTDASQCLWKRYGAHALNTRCARHLGAYHHHHHHHRVDTDETTTDMIDDIERLIQQGSRIALIWNTGMILASVVLLVALGLAGWKLLKKCCCCCGSLLSSSKSSSSSRLFLLFQNSISLNKQERKAQLQQQMHGFYIAAMTLGLTNIFMPAVFLLIAGPIAIASLLWLWYSEFQCCFCCCCSFCSWCSAVGGPKNVTVLLQQGEATTASNSSDNNEKQQIPLLSESSL